jgi:anti-sigma factor RsiW
MTDRYTDHLSDFLDEELSVGLRDEVALHVVGCEECRATLEDLRRVASRARALAAEESGGDQWPAIVARLKRTGSVAGQRQAVRRRFTFSLPQLALAASLLVVVASGGTWLAVRNLVTQPAGAPVASVPTPMVGGGVVPAQPAGLVAGEDYDAAVAELRKVLEQGRTRLDSNTVVVLERSLARIDRAITEAEHALAADPGNAYLSSHLAHTRLRKLDLLHRAATLAAARS